MFDQKTKQKIYSLNKDDNYSKRSLARMYSCSERTIGRIVKEISEQQKDVGSVSEDVVIPEKEYKYFVCFDASMISIIRIDPTMGEPPVTETAYVGSERYEIAKNHYLNGDMKASFESMSYKIAMEAMCLGKVTVHPELGLLEYQDGPTKMRLPTDLAERIVSAIKVEDKETLTGLMNFANRLAENPSRRSVQELYTFLEASDIVIDKDGMILCYKKVRENFTDVHTGKFDNSVGSEPSMPRSMVNDDATITCSSGLHVCSKAYLPHFPGERIVLCSVDPKDVVSVPEDYYSNDGGSVRAKMRVCRYRVVEDLTGKI